MHKSQSLLIFGTTQIMKFTVLGTEATQVQAPDQDKPSAPSYYLGGNGIISALAASKHTPVELVSVIGTDVTKEFLAQVLGQHINIDNLTQIPGKTFFFHVAYNRVTQQLSDEEIAFGVYAQYQPQLTASQTQAPFVLFSGSRPQLSLQVLKQMQSPLVVAVDTVQYHLTHNFEASQALIAQATYLFINDSEYEFLTSKLGPDLFSVFPQLKVIFRKKGKQGIDVLRPSSSMSGSVMSNSVVAFAPTQIVEVKNPVNAGDTTSGTIMGMVASGSNLEENLPQIISQAQHEAALVISDSPDYRKPIAYVES